MGSFIEDLWGSVFTPGPTPTLLIATNVTFAALQVLLFALLLATYSIHFLILSLLSGSLWYAINWFAQELGQVQAQEAEKKKTQAAKVQAQGSTRTPGALDASESDTETENIAKSDEAETPAASDPAPETTASSSAFLQRTDASQGSRKRSNVKADNSGYASTDSEWEKVDEK